MKRDIKGAVMRLEIAEGLIFPDDEGSPAAELQGKKLLSEALVMLKGAPSAERKPRGKKAAPAEDPIEQARRGA